VWKYRDIKPPRMPIKNRKKETTDFTDYADLGFERQNRDVYEYLCSS